MTINIRSSKKGVILKKEANVKEELRLFREFMTSKKITYAALSKEMNYSISHVIKVFNGKLPPTTKFMEFLISAICIILKKDLNEFRQFMKGSIWTTIKLDSFLVRDFF